VRLLWKNREWSKKEMGIDVWMKYRGRIFLNWVLISIDKSKKILYILWRRMMKILIMMMRGMLS
jgi:hypothetical protein